MCCRICFHWITQGRVKPRVTDTMISIFVCSSVSGHSDNWHHISLFPFLPSVLPCTLQRNWILSLKPSTSGWSFSEAQTACVITDRSISLGVPSQLTLLAQEMMQSMLLWHWQAPARRQLHLLEKCSLLARLVALPSHCYASEAVTFVLCGWQMPF